MDIFKPDFVKIFISLITYYKKMSSSDFLRITEGLDDRQKSKFSNYYTKQTPDTNDIDANHFSSETDQPLQEGDQIQEQYQFKEDYKKNLLEKNNLESFFPLLEFILNRHSKKFTPRYQYRSILFPRIIFDVELGAVCYYTIEQSGKRSEDYKLLKNNIPKIPVIFPTTVNDDIQYLKIPTIISRAFNLQDEKKYFLGFNKHYTDTLYFFPKETTSKKMPYSSIDPMVIQNKHLGDEHHIRDFQIPTLFVWHENISIVSRSGTYYLKIPRIFLDISETENMLLTDESNRPENPAYCLAYDLCGTLIYQRILFTKASKQNQNTVYFASDLPEDDCKISKDLLESLPFNTVSLE